MNDWILLGIVVVYMLSTASWTGRLSGRVAAHQIKLIAIIEEQNRSLEADEGLHRQIIELRARIEEIERRLDGTIPE